MIHSTKTTLVNGELVVTQTAPVAVTGEQLAALFWGMHDDDQAAFFNALPDMPAFSRQMGAVATFSRQMGAVAIKTDLNGVRAMMAIGEATS